jgi:hypothetical protein
MTPMLNEFLEMDSTMIKEHNKLIEQHLLKTIQALILGSSFFFSSLLCFFL